MKDASGVRAATVDFFISYTAADETTAEWIAWVLEEAGYRTVIQAWDFRPGREFITEMQQALVAAQRVLAVLSPAYLDSGFARAEWNAALARDPTGAEGRLLPVRVAEVALQGLDLPRVYVDLVGLSEAEAKARLLAGIKGGRAKPTVAPHYPNRMDQPPSAAVLEQHPIAACPYRGLFAFAEGDAELFFGRDEDRLRLVERVRSQPLIAILGASGSGKSSVVFAGLLPALRRDRSLLVASFHPGSDPFGALAVSLLSLLDPDLGEASRLEESAALSRVLRQGKLATVVGRILEKASAQQLIVIADQFEELYTSSADSTDPQAFLDMLIPPVIAQAASPKLRIVLTMRADFYPHAIEHQAFSQALERPVNLRSLTVAQLRQVIEEPARRRGVTFADDLVERILEDVGQGPGRLPLLEFALTQLWEQQQEDRLDHPGYASIGRVSGALTKYADDVYQSMSDAGDQVRTRHVFVDQLVVT